MKLLNSLLLTSLCCLINVDALKFLLYNPKISKSTVGFLNKLGDVLIDAGHEVVHYMPEAEPNFGNASNSKTGRVIEQKCDHLDESQVGEIESLGEEAWFEGFSVWDVYMMTSFLADSFYKSCSCQLKDKKLMQLLRDEKFDLGFTDMWDICGLGVFEKIGLQKHILLYSAYLLPVHSGIFGIPSTPSFIPELQVHGNPKNGLSFTERLSNQMCFLLSYPLLHQTLLHKVANAFSENGVHINLHEKMSQSSYFFINTDEHLDFPRPISHKVINIGGIRMAKSMQTQGKLDKNIQKIFDDSKKGVIFVSFGSIATSFHMPNESKKAFLKAFSAFPDIQFLWKYEKPEDPLVQGLSNVHVQKWWPQKELFAQKKLLAFVSHSGMNSISEATYSGVPIICIPLFGDQPRNALMAESKGIGLVLNKYTLTADVLIDAFRKIIQDKKYKQSAQILSRMIHEKPMSPDERVVRHTEHAFKFDINSNLDIPGRHLNTIVFYNLDVWATILILTALSVYLISKILKLLAKFLIAGKNKDKNKAKKNQ